MRSYSNTHNQVTFGSVGRAIFLAIPSPFLSATRILERRRAYFCGARNLATIADVALGGAALPQLVRT